MSKIFARLDFHHFAPVGPTFVVTFSTNIVLRSSSVEAVPSKFVCRNLFVEVRSSELIRRNAYVGVR